MRSRVAAFAATVATMVAFQASSVVPAADAGAPTGVTMSIDCNVMLTGVQSNCMVSNMSARRDANIVLRNDGVDSILIGAFSFRAQNPDIARLFAPDIQGTHTETLDDNPDASPTIEAMPSYDCGPIGGLNDDPDTDEPGQDSVLTCYDGTATGLSVGGGLHLQVATVHYDIVAADPGPVTLTLTEAAVFTNEFDLLGTCAPVTGVPMPCNPATLTLYCPIDLADVSNDGRINSADMGLTALHRGELPAPAQYDQNFDGRINAADSGLVAQRFFQKVSQCPQ